VTGEGARDGRLAKLVFVRGGIDCGVRGLGDRRAYSAWRQSTYEEFFKGDDARDAVRSDGRLELAHKFTQLADADASYLWRSDWIKGVPYAAGGSPAKVFRLTRMGKRRQCLSPANFPLKR